MPYIYSIVYQPLQSSDTIRTVAFHRVSIEAATLIANYGIEGDRKAGHNPNRHINMMSHEMLLMLEQHGFNTDPGEMGEQMIVDGIDLAALARGDRLLLGRDAIVEVTFPRTSCKRFEQIQDQLQTTINCDLGIFVRVIQSGIVNVGDSVLVAKMEPNIALVV